MNKAFTIRIKAKVEYIEDGLQPVIDALEEAGVAHKIIYKVRLALDEILTNVVSYAYKEGEGEVEIRCQIEDTPQTVILTIVDEGGEFNPLTVDEPELHAAVSDRPIGGLGLFLVKTVMDEVSYRRENNQNILVIKKNI